MPKAEWSGNGEAELLKNFKLSEISLKGGGVSCRPILQEYGHKESFWKSPERRGSVKNQNKIYYIIRSFDIDQLNLLATKWF